MQLFLFISIPLYVGHIIHRHGNQFDGFIQLRSRLIGGVLSGSLGVLTALVLSLIKPEIAPLPLYLHQLLMHVLLPFLMVLLFSRRWLKRQRNQGAGGSLLLQAQIAGFLFVYNGGMYFLFISAHDSLNLFAYPLLNLLAIPVLGRAIWRSQRFEIHWNVIMAFLYSLLFLLIPVAGMLNLLLRTALAWLLFLGLLGLMLLCDALFYRLETDISYRLGLEGRIKPLVRLFMRT